MQVRRADYLQGIRHTLRTMLCLIPVCVVFLTGCGGGEVEIAKPQGELNPVKGKLMLGSRPISGAQVVFVPVEGNLPEAKGKTETDGSFELNTGSQGVGAYAGTYKVRVEPPAPSKGAGRNPRPPFPVEYAGEDSSGLTATVKSGSNVIEPFVIRSTPPRISSRRS